MEEARRVGVRPQRLAEMARRGALRREGHAVYRLEPFPAHELDSYRKATLWPYPVEGVLSHETALDLYELSDVNLIFEGELVYRNGTRTLHEVPGATAGVAARCDGRALPFDWWKGRRHRCSSTTAIVRSVASARWITAHWNGPQQAVAWQHLSADQLERLGLTLDDVRRAAWWIDPSGGRSRGHLAIARALRAAHGWPSVVGQILLVPPFRWLAAAPTR